MKLAAKTDSWTNTISLSVLSEKFRSLSKDTKFAIGSLAKELSVRLSAIIPCPRKIIAHTWFSGASHNACFALLLADPRLKLKPRKENLPKKSCTLPSLSNCDNSDGDGDWGRNFWPSANSSQRGSEMSSQQANKHCSSQVFTAPQKKHNRELPGPPPVPSPPFFLFLLSLLSKSYVSLRQSLSEMPSRGW